MVRRFNYFASTIGRKQIVAITGLGLSLFVLTHMAANLLIFVSPQAYNEYSHALVSNPLIYFAEFGLLTIFVLHLIIAMAITVYNRKSRPQRYAMAASGEKATSVVSQWMWLQGILILIFVVFHLITFKFGVHYTVNYGKGEIRDLYKLVVEVFHNSNYVIGYFVVLILLGLHLCHGVKSLTQTLGANHPKYDCLIKSISYGFAFVVSAGYMAPMLYVFLFLEGMR